MIALALGLSALGATLLAWAAKTMNGPSAPALPSAPTKAPTKPDDEDPHVALAYKGLVAATSAERAALLACAKDIGTSAAALATIIESESGWNPKAPEKQEGLPRAGLIQLTQGANLPPFGKDADKIWSIRSLTITQQLTTVVPGFFKRFQKYGPIPKDAFGLYKLNFLPGVAQKPDDFVIGRKGSAEKLIPGQELSLGSVYEQNHGFDPQKTGVIRWGDVRVKTAKTEARAAGKWVTVSGRIVDPPTSAAASPASKPAAPSGAPAGLAPALVALRAQIDAAYPARLRTSDGDLPDEPSAEETEHATGNAWDCTWDPSVGPDLDKLGAELLKDPRIAAVIWKKQIGRAGGAFAPFEGPPHVRHLHVSVTKAARDDAKPWTLTLIGKASATAVDVPKTDLLTAWRASRVDSIEWVDLPLGALILKVAARPLAVRGVYLPVSYDDGIAFAVENKGSVLPVTKAIHAARWTAAKPEARLAIPALANTGAWSDVLTWSGKINAKAPKYGLIAGPWKAWILTANGGPVLHGLAKDASGATWNDASTAHHAKYRDDYSQGFTPVQRMARVAATGAPVDILRELADNGPHAATLGGPVALPAELRSLL